MGGMSNPIKSDRKFILLTLDSLHAADWYPTPTPTGKPTQVHLFIDLDLPDGPKDPDPLRLQFATRFKSAMALDRFIEMLLIHRESVWGRWTRDKTIAEDLDTEDYS
jgi:hypothetical protein